MILKTFNICILLLKGDIEKLKNTSKNTDRLKTRGNPNDIFQTIPTTTFSLTRTNIKILNYFAIPHWWYLRFGQVIKNSFHWSKKLGWSKNWLQTQENFYFNVNKLTTEKFTINFQNDGHFGQKRSKDFRIFV